MASRTRTGTRATTKAAVRTGAGRRPRRHLRWWAAGAGAVLVAVVLVWVVAGGQRDQPAAGDLVDSFTHVHGLELPGWAPGTVFLSTHHGLIRIEDGEWTQVSEERHDFMGFAAHPDQPGVLYSSGHPAPGSGIDNPVGFMVSTDGGVTWEVRALAGEVDFHAMSVGAAGEVIYGWNTAGRTGLYRSTDDGHTWQVVAAAEVGVAGGALALAVHPQAPDLVWAGTPSGLWRSRDGGASWEQAIGEVPVTAVTVDPTDPDRMLAYAAAPGDGLRASTDGGQSWSAVGWRLDDPADAAGHLAIDPADPDTIYLGTYREDLLRSTDGGGTWQPLARSGVPAG